MRRKYKSIALKKELANDSGKKKFHAMKAQAIVTSQGRIVSLDIAVNYCHDMKLFKMSRRNIGQAGKILADSGYQGLMKIYPQAQTSRKSSKLKPLTAEDKACNHALSKERSKVENIFAKVKTFKMFSTTYRNHRKRFGLRMNLIAGIINHELGFQFCRKSIIWLGELVKRLGKCLWLRRHGL
ncbi:transposase [Streptococcus pneumoniae]|nr:transposase [Streptococcus pneumoniae]